MQDPSLLPPWPHTLLEAVRHFPLRCKGYRFTRNHCACPTMLYISELCEHCTVANDIDYEIDYAWASIHDNGHVVTACDVVHQYAVKAKTSLAPLSRFRGSLVTTAHAHQCCRFQSYAKTVPSRMKLTSEIDKAWTTFLGSTTTDHMITACDVWL